jgi:hypothetical protein
MTHNRMDASMSAHYFTHKRADESVRVCVTPTREYSGGRIHAGIQEGCHSWRGFCRCLKDLTGRDDEDDVGAVKTFPNAARMFYKGNPIYPVYKFIESCSLPSLSRDK